MSPLKGPQAGHAMDESTGPRRLVEYRSGSSAGWNANWLQLLCTPTTIAMSFRKSTSSEGCAALGGYAFHAPAETNDQYRATLRLPLIQSQRSWPLLRNIRDPMMVSNDLAKARTGFRELYGVEVVQDTENQGSGVFGQSQGETRIRFSSATCLRKNSFPVRANLLKGSFSRLLSLSLC